MATKFITLTQIHRPKTLLSTTKSRRRNSNKPKPFKTISENMLNNVFSGKTLTEIYHNKINSHPLTNPLLFIEDPSVKEEETNQQEHGKVSNKDGKSITATKYGDLRRDVARLSLLWYMKCSISHILRKARAFYNEFCCDTYAESNTMAVVEPYFSIPVIN
ncbi:hypothetical protein AT4G19430 [Arabidopsis thaliana]|uniref:At4g19430 n=1 Tax=Arabidopsis thaliana TaxID=3702 RepID=Q67Y03_ARATH|nr:uncharacterized protein AT4G19430 [Arabidopsis thaliana]ABI49489.1 At4g19430 [Arabidopsis thaliana]AEE84181.1 hypothetical protein AT4G19430 [Arabidopsis thaliana]BAD43387.1 putative protein [Arabidopsis thaliana]BAD44428.1 putative protein [Arabidopsis thaliana]|eukprot:NP_567586.1 hypothetical protein AT4G19430 [Arabidopsis thaliana]